MWEGQNLEMSTSGAWHLIVYLFETFSIPGKGIIVK